MHYILYKSNFIKSNIIYSKYNIYDIYIVSNLEINFQRKSEDLDVTMEQNAKQYQVKVQEKMFQGKNDERIYRTRWVVFKKFSS